MLHSNIVYEFKCNICNDIHGKTKRHLKVRVCEHLGITPITGVRLKAQKKCSIWLYFPYGI